MEGLKIVLGLGNPGVRYSLTRHNLGFRVMDRLAGSLGASFRTEDALCGKAWTAEVPEAGGGLVLAKPRTYMNRSGIAARVLCRHYAALPSQLLVVYDDADLELGRLRIRPRGRAGGHNGMRSLIEVLRSEEIPRIRMGVRGARREESELADYVLAPFDPAEEAVAEALVELASESVRWIQKSDLMTAMNQYNPQSASPAGRAERSDEEE